MTVIRRAALTFLYNAVYFLQKLLSADQSGQRILFTGRSRLVSIFYHDLTSKTQLSPLPSRSLSVFFCRHTNRKTVCPSMTAKEVLFTIFIVKMSLKLNRFFLSVPWQFYFCKNSFITSKNNRAILLLFHFNFRVR